MFWAALSLALLVAGPVLSAGSDAPSKPSTFLASSTKEEDPGRLSRAFEQFEKDFGKNYSAADRERRFAAFRGNLLFVETESKKNHSYTLRLNELADLEIGDLVDNAGKDASPVEMERGVQGEPGPVSHNEVLPPSVDWRMRGAITPVLNQGRLLGGGSSSCGSCWAFAATGAISAAWQIATGSLVSLSEQQFVDCTPGSCADGGIAGVAMQYAASNSLCTRQTYPYRAMDVGTCRAQQCDPALPPGSLSQVLYIPFSPRLAYEAEQMLMQRLTLQPAAVALFASISFQNYGSGVFDGPCDGTATQSINHAVVFVGYGTADGANYFLLKNSWGLTWGEDGYMRLAHGPGSGGRGLCNCFTRAAFPVISGRYARPTTTRGPPSSPSCCASCPGSAFCSPQSRRCYNERRKDYYEICPRSPPLQPSCCSGCQGSAFCSPRSGHCYNERRRDYYETCRSSPPVPPGCCSWCQGFPFCSPHSGRCYSERRRDYYETCPSSCCTGCPGSAFCSPVSRRCYHERRRDYYETCP